MRIASAFLKAFQPTRTYYLLFAAVLLLQLGPIWLTPYPAMHDYPNHLARIHVLHEYSVNQTYQAVYEIDRNLMPNLAMDLIIPPLMDILSVETAGKVFLSLVVLAFNLGIHLMGIALNGRHHWNALAGTFFTYNSSLAYGFVNYVLGIGVFFITLALWLRFRSQWTLMRIVSISALALSCYVSHLSAFVFLGLSLVCLIGLESVQAGHFRREHLVALAPLAPPTIAYFFYSSGHQPKTPMQWWEPLIESKIKGLLIFPFVSYNLLLDLGMGLAFVSLVVLSLKVKGARLLSPQFLLVGGIFMLLYALAPSSAGGTFFVDRRFLLPSCIFLLLALRIETSKPLGCYVLAGLISITAIRGAEVWYYWNNIGRAVQAQVRLLDRLPDGVRLYPLVVRNPSRGWLWDMHFFFLPHYATVYRHAYVPTIYAQRGVHPLNIRRPETLGVIDPADVPTFAQVNWQEIFSTYDYLWAYKLSDDSKRFLLSKGEVVGEVDGAILVRIKETSRGTGNL